jgi:hypothetical protein
VGLLSNSSLVIGQHSKGACDRGHTFVFWLMSNSDPRNALTRNSSLEGVQAKFLPKTGTESAITARLAPVMIFEWPGLEQTLT